jgi:hypothetical protein
MSSHTVPACTPQRGTKRSLPNVTPRTHSYLSALNHCVTAQCRSGCQRHSGRCSKIKANLVHMHKCHQIGRCVHCTKMMRLLELHAFNCSQGYSCKVCQVCPKTLRHRLDKCKKVYATMLMPPPPRRASPMACGYSDIISPAEQLKTKTERPATPRATTAAAPPRESSAGQSRPSIRLVQADLAAVVDSGPGSPSPELAQITDAPVAHHGDRASPRSHDRTEESSSPISVADLGSMMPPAPPCSKELHAGAGGFGGFWSGSVVSSIPTTAC